MGKPFLGMLLGALLSGGVGYYGYNRLNNPNYQGYKWLDKTLGYAPATRTPNQPQPSSQNQPQPNVQTPPQPNARSIAPSAQSQPQPNVQNPTLASPATAEADTLQSRSLSSGPSPAQTPQQGEQADLSADDADYIETPDEDIDTSILDLDF